jgi:hypothetical protein
MHESVENLKARFRVRLFSLGPKRPGFGPQLDPQNGMTPELEVQHASIPARLPLASAQIGVHYSETRNESGP